MIRFKRLLCAAAVSAIHVLTTGAWLPAAAQPALPVQTEGVFSIGIPRATDSVPDNAAQTPPVVPAPATLQAVWDLGAAGNWDSAGRLLKSLESSHDGWKAPANLRTYLITGQRDQRIRDALTAKDWAAALALIPAAGPNVCEAPFHLWSRAEALEEIGEPDPVREFYVRVLSNCTDPSLVAALAERSVSVLDANGLAVIRGIGALERSDDPKVVIAFGRIVRAEHRLRFDSATEKGDLAAAARLAETSEDPHLLSQAGWVFLAADAAVSTGYFERALEFGADSDARRGLVIATLAAGNIPSARQAIAQADDPAIFADLAARADLGEAISRRGQGDWQGAVALATKAGQADPGLNPSSQDVIGGAFLDAAGAAYEKGDFAGARRLARQSAEYPSSRRAGLMRAAWSDLQLGEEESAASTFSRLYLEVPDAESAEGYALAAEKTGNLDSAAALARTLGGPLGPKVDARFAAAAFEGGDYLTARAYAPSSYEALEGAGNTWYRQAISARSQGGTSGENRLRGFVSTTSAGTARGPNRYEAGLAVYTLDPGRSISPGGRASRETFAAPYLAWSREGDTHLAARIGLLPVAADADPVLTAEFAVSHEAGGRMIEGRAFSHPKTDSVLSFAGQKDASGTTFGRVAESGALVRARLPVGKQHSVQADLSAAHLGGENTADNSRVSAGVSASRSIESDGFAYLVTGPFYQFQSYDRNTNFFTSGHGGYFSPQSFHRAGWSANAQTDPLKNWIAKGDIAVAYESVDEDPARANPLLPGPQPTIGGSRSTGVAAALDVAAARRVSSEVIVSANLSAIASQAYEDFRLGIAFTWVPGGRAGLIRTDLPTDPFTPGAWIRP